MPLTRKQQILAKLEVSEGTQIAVAAADATLVFNPSISDEQQRSDRIPASPALGRRPDQVGAGSRSLSFEADFAGSGGTGEPDWSKFVKSCGFAQGTAIRKFVCTSAGSGTWQIGEKVYESGQEATNYGICVNNFDQPASSGTLYVLWIVGTGTKTGGGTNISLVGKNSAAALTTTADSTLDASGHSFTATSKKQVAITVPATSTGSWEGSGANPTITAEVTTLLITRAGVTVGACRAMVDNTAGNDWVTFYAAMQFGDIAVSDVLTTPAAETATVSAVSQAFTPSLTFRHNLDGYARDIFGARGNFVLSGEAGGPMKFAFDFQGSLGAHADLGFASGAMLSPTLPPQLLGATFGIGVSAVVEAVPLRSVEIDPGNAVSMRPDAEATGGWRSAEITDRDPTITLSTDQTGVGALDWRGFKDSGIGIRFGLRLGSAAGNILHVLAPDCQITEVSDEDADGVAGLSVTLKPRMWDDGTITEEGDNDLFIAVTGG